jgi:hypothetical protein
MFSLILCTNTRPAILYDSVNRLHSCWKSPPLFDNVMSLYCLLRTAIYPNEKLWPSLPRKKQHIIITQAPVKVIILKKAVESILLDATIQLIKP